MKAKLPAGYAVIVARQLIAGSREAGQRPDRERLVAALRRCCDVGQIEAEKTVGAEMAAVDLENEA